MWNKRIWQILSSKWVYSLETMQMIVILLLLIQCFSTNYSHVTSSSMNSDLKRRLNITNDHSLSPSTNRIHTFDLGHPNIKDASTLTKTQIKVIVTVVLIISLIMLIIMIFRFKNACRTQEADNFHTDIIRNRASQYSEPSSRRGSVGYYTQRYNRTTNHRFDEPLNLSLPVKRLSIPACDPSSKSTAVVFLSTPTGNPTDVPYHHHHHVTTSCDTSNTPNQPLTIDLEFISSSKSNVDQILKEENDDEKRETQRTSSELIGESASANELTRSNEDDVCDDQTPLLISELTSTIKDSSTYSTRKYSLNALLPLVRASASHPLCSSLTSTIAGGIDVGTDKGVDLKSHRRLSFSSALRRTSFAKQPQSFSATIDSTTTNQTASPPILPSDSDTSDRTTYPSRKQHRKKSSSITPIETSSLTSYPKDFMHKIERFRFIDDSASSTTTVTSPVESLEPVNTHQGSSRLLPSAEKQFDHYARTKYQTDDDDDVDSLIDYLNSDLLTNGCYTDMNVLNPYSSTLRPQSFQTVHVNSFQAIPRNQQHEFRQTIPINIPHSITAFPLSRQRNQVETNEHSRSMEFQSISNRRDLTSTINETSSSSTTTLTSIRSSTSIEFDDNSKPSGVLVDDDFLPMSSPVDEHFWNMTVKTHYGVNTNECFPNVGSSPDVEVRHFDLQQLNTLSETSCDEDDDDDDEENHDSISSNIPPEIFAVHEYKIKELQNPFLIIKSTSLGETISEQTPSIDSTEQFSINREPSTNSPDQSLLGKFSSPIRSDFVCETVPSVSPKSEFISEEDGTHESSPNDASDGEESADNGEIDLVREFELSQKEGENNLWSINDRDVYIIHEDDLISGLDPTAAISNRSQPTSIMKITNNKTTDHIDEQQQTLKPKVRFNLDPQYEREREWNKVNKLLGNSVEWTDEFEV